jgi:ferric-dicitrate binding protein FerR (iron transport regulator)
MSKQDVYSEQLFRLLVNKYRDRVIRFISLFVKALNHIRKEQEKNLEIDSLDIDSFLHTETTPESIYLSKEMTNELNEAVNELPHRTQLAFHQMLHDSEKDTLLYNSLKEYWDADVVPDKVMTAGTDAKIFSHIRTDSFKRNFIRFFYCAAAVLLLLLTCGTFYHYKTRPVHTYTYATQNNISDFVLEDGTKIKLNQNSSVTFTSDFGKKDRKIDLIGEAFFEVQKDTNKIFAVRTQGTETEVLGTTFNVQSNEREGSVTVALVEGSVRFVTDNCNVLLHPKEEFVYHAVTGNFNKRITDLQINTAWTVGKYVYTDIAFGEFLKKLERIYHVSITLNCPELETKKITALFITGESIDEILSALEDELKFKYEKTDKKTINIETP